MSEQSPLAMQIARAVKRLRLSRGWSQTQLADAIPGWGRTTVAKLENGRRRDLTVDELVAVAAVFAVPVTDLLPLDREQPSLAAVLGKAQAALLDAQAALGAVDSSTRALRKSPANSEEYPSG